MTIFRRGRYLFWIGKELFDKYTKSLVVGFAVGILTMIVLWFLYPTLIEPRVVPVQSIGVIGDFTPSTLPIFIQEQLSLGLTTLGADGAALPGLAESWEATDSGKEYKFVISNDYVWPDGSRVESKDVNYSIRDVTLQPIDASTLKISLKDPYSPFATLVAKPIFRRGLVGFGPYKLSNISLKGDYIQYLRLISKTGSAKSVLDYRFYRTENQVITAYKLGDIDEINDISSSSDLNGWKNTAIEKNTRYDQIVAVFFNLKDPLLSERSVRQALGYALPKTANERAYTPISKRSWAYSDKVRKYDPDLNEAKKILSDAKIDLKGKLLTISTFAQYVDEAQAIAQSWNELGLSTKVKVENTLTDTFQVLYSTQNLPPDPDQYPMWHSTQSNTNITKYVNVKIDKILEDARKESDTDIRKKLYADFQRYLVEDAPAIFYYYPTRYKIIRK